MLAYYLIVSSKLSTLGSKVVKLAKKIQALYFRDCFKKIIQMHLQRFIFCSRPRFEHVILKNPFQMINDR